MTDKTEEKREEEVSPEAEVQDDAGQAIQINENTIEDPSPPSEKELDDELHSRRDVPKRDQALQINENTIADED